MMTSGHIDFGYGIVLVPLTEPERIGLIARLFEALPGLDQISTDLGGGQKYYHEDFV
jgi:hypothetical protein